MFKKPGYLIANLVIIAGTGLTGPEKAAGSGGIGKMPLAGSVWISRIRRETSSALCTVTGFSRSISIKHPHKRSLRDNGGMALILVLNL